MTHLGVQALAMSSAGDSDVWARLVEASRRNGAPLDDKRYKVLVAEDELWAALDVEWVVNKLGHEVVGLAATAEEVVRLCEEKSPDLVLMDIRLADDSDGIATATAVRELYNIPSLFVTSHGELGTRLRADSAMPVGFVEKPFAPVTLARAITAAFQEAED